MRGLSRHLLGLENGASGTACHRGSWDRGNLLHVNGPYRPPPHDRRQDRQYSRESLTLTRQLASLLGHSLKINVLNFIRLLVSPLGHSHTCKINVLNFIRLLASLLGHSHKISVLSFIRLLASLLGHSHKISVLNFIRLLASLLGHPHEIKVLNFIIFLNPRVVFCFASRAGKMGASPAWVSPEKVLSLAI